MGDLPLMTDNGTFVINGTERVIVSQMHRSPGVFYDHDKGKTHSSGKFLFSARIIPYRGSWLDFEFDAKDLIHVRIDRRRKLPATTLLLALGLSQEEILGYFYDAVTFTRSGQGWKQPFRPERLRGQKLTADLINAESGDVLAEAGTKLTPRLIKRLEEQGLQQLYVSAEELVGRYVAADLSTRQTGLIHAEAGDELTPELLARLIEAKVEDAAGARHRPRHGRPLHAQHAGRRALPQPRGRAARHLPRAAPGRAAESRHRREPVPRPVLRQRALRPVAGRPGQDERAPQPRHRRHGARAAQRGHPRGDQAPDRDQGRPRRDRRHRPPRQPPGALGRRADGEPVPGRPAAHGARGARAHELGRDRRRDAARPDQRQARGGGGARVLRLLAALASSWTRPTRSRRSPTSAGSRRSGRAA